MSPIPNKKNHSHLLHGDLVKVCQSAYDFALNLRRSPSVYRFEIPSTTTLVESENEVYAFEGNRDPNSKDHYAGKAIALGITEALVKYVEQQRLILPKPAVTTRRLT